MPILDGWQFMDEFITLSPLIPKRIVVYIVSSSIDDRDIRKAKSYEQVSDFIVKPITTAMFRKMVEETTASV
jgi:CheY-like chemotaxis protein